MPTSTELRIQASLELANRANEYYAKTTLQELAQRLNREARQAERRQRDLANFRKLQPNSLA